MEQKLIEQKWMEQNERNGYSMNGLLLTETNKVVKNK